MKANVSLKGAKIKKFYKTCLAVAVSHALCSANAATIVVTTIHDVSTTDSDCSLREAIVSANTNPVSTDSGCIAGEPGLDTIDLSFIGSVSLQQGLPMSVSESLVISGASSSTSTIDGGYYSGILELQNADLTINSLTISNGSSSSGTGGISVSNGGSLTINDVLILNNQGEEAGGISVASGSHLSINNSLLIRNRAASGAGSVLVSGSGTSAEIQSSQINENFGGTGFGGVAAYAGSYVTISDSAFEFNGIGVHVDGASLNIKNSTFTNNESNTPGSALSVGANSFADVRRATFVSNGSLYGNASSAIAVLATGTLSLQNSLMTGNSPGDPLIVNNGTISESRHNLFGDSRSTTAQALSGLMPSDTDITTTSDGMQPTNFENIVELRKNFASTTGVHKLYKNSPAIDAGDTALCNAAPLNGLDQRGIPIENECDIGAFELTTSTITVNSVSAGSDMNSCTFSDAIRSTLGRSSHGGCAAGADATAIRFDPSVFPDDSDNQVSTDELIFMRYVDLSIYGRGTPGLTIEATGSHGIFYGYKSSLDFENLVLTGGKTNLGRGGAVSAIDSRVRVAHSMIKGNTSGSSGGGIGTSNSNVLIDSSTIHDNESDFGGGVGHSASFGSSSFKMVNSTVSGNRGRLLGGGLSLNRISDIEIINSTITNNYAQEGGGIEFVRNTSRSPNIINTIISGNDAIIATEIYSSGSLTLANDKNNIFGDSSHSSSEAFNSFTPSIASLNLTADSGRSTPIRKILGPLANNGGIGLTHRLPLNSPAINAGDQNTCERNMIVLDQLGVERDGQCDIGAFESDFANTDQSQCLIIKSKNGKIVTFCL